MNTNKFIENLKDASHSKSHFLLKKRYSIGFYTGGYKGNWSDLTNKQKEKCLSYNWYVRWSYRNPKTKKLERQKNIYDITNSFKTRAERMEVLEELAHGLKLYLDSGYSPYSEPREKKDTNLLCIDAINYAMDIKKNEMNHASYIRFKSYLKAFKEYLILNGYNVIFIKELTKQDVNDYLNELHKTQSSRSRNNSRGAIASVFQCLENNGIHENIVKSIPLLKTKPKRNKTYSDKQVEELFTYMEKNHPQMLLFVKFVSYNFLRPLEVCRLDNNSFDFEAETLTVKTKTDEIKTKVIPSILIGDIPKPETGFLFTKDGFWGEWNISENSKRGHFSREFKKIKDTFGLGDEYGIYSFRHYYISKLYNYFRKEKNLSVTQTYDNLMMVTGHNSLKGLQNYLRSIDAEKPQDYSKGLL